MEFRTVVLSKGEMVIPKVMLEALGIHQGSELTLSLRKDKVLEVKVAKGEILDFAAKEAANKPNTEIDNSTIQTLMETTF